MYALAAAAAAANRLASDRPPPTCESECVCARVGNKTQFVRKRRPGQFGEKERGNERELRFFVCFFFSVFNFILFSFQARSGRSWLIFLQPQPLLRDGCCCRCCQILGPQQELSFFLSLFFSLSVWKLLLSLLCLPQSVSRFCLNQHLEGKIDWVIYRSCCLVLSLSKPWLKRKAEEGGRCLKNIETAEKCEPKKLQTQNIWTFLTLRSNVWLSRWRVRS